MTPSFADALAEVDRAIIACRRQRISDARTEPIYNPAYLAGINDGLTGLRVLLRSEHFHQLTESRRTKCPSK